MQAYSLSSLENDVFSIVKPHCCTTILMFPVNLNCIDLQFYANSKISNDLIVDYLHVAQNISWKYI